MPDIETIRVILPEPRLIRISATNVPTIISSGAFIDLTDVPNSYSGQSLKSVRVNAGETGLEFTTASGGGVWGSITGTLSNQTDLQSALDAKVPTSRTVNGHALSSDVTVTPTDLSLVIGTNVEAWSANLDAWSALATSAKQDALGFTAVPTTRTLTIGGTALDLSSDRSWLGNVTNDTQTKAAIVPNTAPSAGQLLAGNAGGTAYAPATLSGSGATATLSSAGVLTLSAIANATLSNSVITIAGTATSLGGTITLDTISGVSSNGFLKRTGANAWTNDNSTYITGNQTITLFGVVTGSGATSITTSLGSFSSAALLAALTDETGSGSAVFGTSPTLSDPVVGTQSTSDNSTKAASTAYVTTAIANAVAGVNPAVAVQAATTVAGDTSGFTYNNGVSGVGATLTGPTANTAVTIDGYTFTALGQRLLVKNDTQSPSGAFNGVYYVTTLQAPLVKPVLTRALDYNQPSDINNTGAIPVINGTVNSDTSWLLTSSVTTVGTDPLTYVQFTINPTTIVTTARTLTIAGTAQDLSADRTWNGPFQSTYGGTGNGFTKFSGPTTTEKTKTVRDASDTMLELGGSYIPTGTWTSLTLVTPALGTPASGVMTNVTGTANGLTAGDVTRNHAVYAGASPPTVDVGIFTITVTGLDFKTAGTNDVFTVPAGRRFVLISAQWTVTAVTSAGAGTQSGMQIIESGASSGMSATCATGSHTPAVGIYYSSSMFSSNVTTPSVLVSCAAGNKVQEKHTTSHAGSTTVTGTVFVTGFYSS